MPTTREPDALAPQAIHEALDFLALQWKATLNHELFVGVPIEALGGLAAPVIDRDDFKSRISDLAAVIERMLSGATKPASTPDDEWRGSLNRVEAALRDAGIDPPVAAIRALRDVVAVRTGFQHPGSRDLGSLLTKLGISVPVINWGHAWRVVQSRVAEAITELRVTLRDH